MCQHLKFADGTEVILCGSRGKTKFCSCGRVADFLCDWKVPERHSGTCDAPIYKQHATEVAPEKHLCVFHAHAFELWKKKHPDFDLRRGEQGKLFAEVKA